MRNNSFTFTHRIEWIRGFDLECWCSLYRASRNKKPHQSCIDYGEGRAIIIVHETKDQHQEFNWSWAHMSQQYNELCGMEKVVFDWKFKDYNLETPTSQLGKTNVLLQDNTSVIQLERYSKKSSTKRTRHILIRYFLCNWQVTK